MNVRLHEAVGLANDLGLAIAGNFDKPLVDVGDHALGIGNGHNRRFV